MATSSRWCVFGDRFKYILPSLVQLLNVRFDTGREEGFDTCEKLDVAVELTTNRTDVNPAEKQELYYPAHESKQILRVKKDIPSKNVAKGVTYGSAHPLGSTNHCVDAHGHLNQPSSTFQDGASHVNWVTQIDNFWDIGSGGDQVGKYKTLAKEKGVSVRDVILQMVGNDKKCGFTRTDVDPKPVPTNGKAVWLGNDGGGFTHVGPCELYIDDKMVLHSDDCQADYPGGPNDSGIMSEMPVDYSSCNGDCTFSIYWLGFQNAQWQAYINCVPLSGTGATTQSSATPTTKTPATNSS
eukprot:jgi/Phyca11/18657/fgenesh1_pg.PHYCAscaffold_39_\